MEEETKKTEEEVEEAPVEQEQPAQKKGLPLNLVILGILGLCIVGGVLFVWKSGLLANFSVNNEPITEDIGSIKKELGPIYSMDTFIVNLIGGQGKNYLKTKIDLELDNVRLTEEINKRLPQFRDAILTMLSSKTQEDIKTLEGKYQLRAEIITMLNQYLNTGKIRNVFFTDFIIQ
jgi:flagellar FliL protein